MNRLLNVIILIVLQVSLSAVGLIAQNAVALSTDEKKTSVTGTVVEAGSNAPLSLSKVYVYSKDGKRVARTLSLDDGIFHLLVVPGLYDLLVENIGHKSKRISIEVKSSELSLGRIILEVGEELDAAAVETRTLIHRQGTRITYDVSKDPDAAKISMTEMASRIPDLKVGSRNGKLEFEHTRIGKILIDQEESGLINASRQYPMEFIKADHMKTIELVLPGDPEYQNTEPIMLITLAKKLPYGVAGQICAQSDTKNSHKPSADVVINTPLIGVGVGYSYEFSGPPALTNESVREMGDMTIDSYSASWSRSNSHSFHTSLFRDIKDKELRVNASLGGAFSDSKSFAESSTTVFGAGNELVESSSNNTNGTSKSPFRLNGAMALSGDFGPKTSNGRYYKYHWKTEYSYSNNQTNNEESYGGGDIQTSSNGRAEHKASATFTIRDITINQINLSSSFSGGYYNRHFANNSVSATESRGIDYRQHVGYISAIMLASALENKLSAHVTLKGEYVGNFGTFFISNETVPLDWQGFNILPSVGVSWNFKRSSLSFGFNRGVRRPNINQLNPYVNRNNPYNLVTGNPELKGESSSTVSLNYLLRPSVKWIRMLSIGSGWSSGNNSIQRIISTDSNGVATSTFANIGKNSSLSLDAQAMLAPVKSLSISIVSGYSKTWVTLPGGMTNTIDTPKLLAGINWSSKWFEVNGDLHLVPSTASVQSAKLIMEPQADISISRYFSKPRLGVSLIVSDVFHSGGRKESIIVYDNFLQYNYNERLGRKFGIYVYWRFGRFKAIENVNVKAYDM
ncbi:MAG: TonB-dependent receptor [Bacteroidales bacterium]|nr:TonB-dependent receptor [Bacteroidales bacterium]